MAQQPDDQLGELAKPLEVFGAALIYTIRPQGMRTYLDLHGQTAKVRANRERALLSHIFNQARAWGYTVSVKPAASFPRAFRSGEFLPS